MIIEFSGLAGSGKSTVARKLSVEKNIPVVKINNKLELLRYNFLFFINYPVIFIVRFLFVIINSVNFKMFYYKFMNSFLHTNAKYQKALQYKLCILDQGFVHSISSIFDKEINQAQIEKFLKYIIIPDRLIFFTASKEILEDRYKNRGYFARQFMDQQYLMKWKEITYKNSEVYKSLIPILSKKSIIIDGGQNLEAVIQQVADFIQSN